MLGEQIKYELGGCVIPGPACEEPGIPPVRDSPAITPCSVIFGHEPRRRHVEAVIRLRPSGTMRTLSCGHPRSPIMVSLFDRAARSECPSAVADGEIDRPGAARRRTARHCPSRRALSGRCRSCCTHRLCGGAIGADDRRRPPVPSGGAGVSGSRCASPCWPSSQAVSGALIADRSRRPHGPPAPCVRLMIGDRGAPVDGRGQPALRWVSTFTGWPGFLCAISSRSRSPCRPIAALISTS